MDYTNFTDFLDFRVTRIKTASKTVARNEMEGGFKERTLKFQSILFNRKEQ